MTTFDDRERGYEARFAHDQDLIFKAEMRRDKLLGLWAGERMGLTGETLTAYVQSLTHADLAAHGAEGLFHKLMTDLAAKGVECLPQELRAQMDELLHKAQAEIAAGH